MPLLGTISYRTRRASHAPACGTARFGQTSGLPMLQQKEEAGMKLSPC